MQIASFYVNVPSNRVLPQKYTIHCIKTGYAYGYNFTLKLDDVQLINNTGCTSLSPCDNSYLLHSSNHTYDHTLNVTWDGLTVSNGTGDQMYQCVLEVANHVTRTRNITIQGNTLCLTFDILVLSISTSNCSLFSYCGQQDSYQYHCQLDST